MSHESLVDQSGYEGKDAALKANGSPLPAAGTQEAGFDNADSIFDFANQGNPWVVTLSQTADNNASPFQSGVIFLIVPTDQTTASIDFTGGGKLDATYDPNTGILSYKEDLVNHGEITLYKGSTPEKTALSGVLLKADPEPVAIWAAEENGG